MYERACQCLVRPRENIEQQTELMDQEVDQEVDSPFNMNQIETSIMDEDPARERANLILARLDPEMQVVQSGLTKSEPIMIEPDIVTSCADAEPNAWGIEAPKKAKRIDRAMENFSKDYYRFAKLERSQNIVLVSCGVKTEAYSPQRGSHIFLWRTTVNSP